ncbi:DgyrCDS11230 [Dimorphilus gyrociliatus]|uniref:DgyrCDS11230 n=1 Tax=Dimorphilus gyrociliatus TaxID=2664684 RepID=A0A7I8W3Q5_9ANNE|nr:DgyrCDS11230 [Dimorphilus gyrociliatus]
MVDSTPNEDWLDKLDGPKYYHDFEDVRLGQNPFSNREDADQYFGVDHEKLGSQKHDSQSDSAIDDYETAGSSDHEEVEEEGLHEEVSEVHNEEENEDENEEENEVEKEEEREEETEEVNKEANEEQTQPEEQVKDISNEDTSENKNNSRRPPRNLCTNFEEWDKMKAKCKVANNSSAHPHPTRKKIVDKSIQKLKNETSPHTRTRNASSVSTASSSSSSIKLPTIPTTPEFMRRNRNAKPKSTEDQQLQEINRKKEEMRKASIKNKANLIKNKTATSRVQKPTPKSPTRPEEFHFASDSRLRSNHKQDQIDNEFANGLRSRHISKPHKIGPTIPQPFHFHEMHAKKNVETYKTDAEKVNAFSSKTPDRFRTSKRNAGPDLPKKTRLTVTVPKTPNFSKHPRRHTTILSAREKEELEIEDMNKHQFKAHSVNKKVMEVPKLKKPDAKPATVIEPFDFESSHRPRKEHENMDESIVHFHAKPAPKHILKHAIGIPTVETAPITVPESPAFQTRQRSRPQKPVTVEKPKNNNEHKTKVHHGVPFIPKSATNHKVSAEASTPIVYKRSKAMLEHRDKFVEKELKKEKEMRHFEATLLPYSVENPHNLPAPKEIPITKPKPFDFLVDERGEKYKEKLAHLISEEEEKLRKEAEFKAKDPVILKSKPFAPKIDKKPITHPEGFQFATEKRAMEREDYESWKRQAEEEKAALQAARKREKEEMERSLAEEARKKTILKANPIRTYKPVHPFSPKPLTEPKTPKFSNRTRCHEDEILKDIQNNF